MLSRDEVVKQVREFKEKHGLNNEQDENVVATLHLQNVHKLHLHAAQDQTSRGGSDKGIDAWHYDAKSAILTLYQSKLTTAKAAALKGFDDLTKASLWLGDVLSRGELDMPATNGGIYNLARCLAANHHQLNTVRFVLLSPFDRNEVIDAEAFTFARNDLAQSQLYRILSERDGTVELSAAQYILDDSEGVPPIPEYRISVRDETALTMDGGFPRLYIILISLHSLVLLFRHRSNIIFEKNVRLYLQTKEAKARLEHPMEETFEQICRGTADPSIFAFYHVGVTLSTTGFSRQDGELCIADPQVINGCQTINIASRYFAKLESIAKKGSEATAASEKIERFKKIPVAAKIITRALNVQLREIANCNNRQNPIEPWQLFANDPIHCEIEDSLRDIGVFYERQKGRFDSEIKRLKVIQTYYNTNNTYVTVVPLGQVICLCRQQMQLAAKPSEIFVNKERHDGVFTNEVPDRPHDVVWASNAHRAVKKGMQKYLSLDTHQNEQTHRIFKKPLVLQSMHFLAMMYLYQKKREVSAAYACKLNRIAAPTLVEEAQTCYRAVIRRTKEFYLRESKNLSIDVSWRSLDGFLLMLCSENGFEYDGPMPFGEHALDWAIDEDDVDA